LADNAKQALDLIDRMGVALSAVLIDLDLPSVSGFDLIATVRTKFPQLPIIAISGVFQPTALQADY
jgi:YesN/AraC family two-component response regulator